MLNEIYAAEVQYRHENARIDRELLRLAEMAERGIESARTSRRRFGASRSAAARTATGLTAASAPAPAPARFAWPRPISEHGRLAATPAIAAPTLARC